MAQVNCIREMFFEKGMSYADIVRNTGYNVKTSKEIHPHGKLQPATAETYRKSWLQAGQVQKQN